MISINPFILTTIKYRCIKIFINKVAFSVLKEGRGFSVEKDWKFGGNRHVNN